MNSDDNRANVPVDKIAVEIGAELGAARKASKKSVAELAQSLRLSRNCLESLEAGEWSPLGAPVYASGYVRNYARHLDVHGIDERLTTWTRHSVEALELQEPEILLQPAQRFNSFERYARAMTYVAATSLLAVPLWWFFQNGGRIPSPPTTVAATQIDTNQVALPAKGDLKEGPEVELSEVDVSKRRNAGPTVASLTPPVLSKSLSTQPDSLEEQEMLVFRTPEPAKLILAASESAWVEITTASGERLEYDLLPGGTEREYPMSENLSLRIGNAYAVSVTLDGAEQDMSPHIRNDVASFELAMPDNKPQ